MELISQFGQIKCINWFQLFILPAIPNPDTHSPNSNTFAILSSIGIIFDIPFRRFLPLFFHVRNFTGFAIISIEMYLFCSGCSPWKIGYRCRCCFRWQTQNAVIFLHLNRITSCRFCAAMCLFVLALECHRMLQMNLIWFRYKRDFFLFLLHRVQNHRQFCTVRRSGNAEHVRTRVSNSLTSLNYRVRRTKSKESRKWAPKKKYP